MSYYNDIVWENEEEKNSSLYDVWLSIFWLFFWIQYVLDNIGRVHFLLFQLNILYEQKKWLDGIICFLTRLNVQQNALYWLRYWIFFFFQYLFSVYRCSHAKYIQYSFYEFLFPRRQYIIRKCKHDIPIVTLSFFFSASTI